MPVLQDGIDRLIRRERGALKPEANAVEFGMQHILQISPALGNRDARALEVGLALRSREVPATRDILAGVEDHEMERKAIKEFTILLDAAPADYDVVNRDAEAGSGIGAREQAGVAGDEVELARLLLLGPLAWPDAACDNPLLQLLRFDVNAPRTSPGEAIGDCRLAGAWDARHQPAGRIFEAWGEAIKRHAEASVHCVGDHCVGDSERRTLQAPLRLRP